MMASPTTAPRPITRLNTPAGRPERLRMSASAQPQPGTRSAGLNSTQLPYASAGAIFQAGIAIGKFQGVIRPTTPIGSRGTPTPLPRPLGGKNSPPACDPPPPKKLKILAARPALGPAGGRTPPLSPR